MVSWIYAPVLLGIVVVLDAVERYKIMRVVCISRSVYSILTLTFTCNSKSRTVSSSRTE